MATKVDDTIYVYMKAGKVTLWIKKAIWMKWVPRTPKGYADVTARVLKQRPDYGPCWWGTQEQPPHETGYVLVGTLAKD